MEELKNILYNDDDLNEEKLRKYLSGEGTAEETHAVEKAMADSEFVNDAVEGLQTFSSESKLNDYVSQINKNLNHQLQGRKLKQEKRKIRDLSWTILAVITILLLCILAFIVIKMFKDHEAERRSVEIHVYHQLNDDNPDTDLTL